MNDDYDVTEVQWMTTVCPLCNSMQKLQLKAFTKPYCYLIARTMDDGGFFTSTTSHPRHTCIYADLQQVLLCGAMRLRLNLSQPRQNILIPSSADEDGHGLGLGRYCMQWMNDSHDAFPYLSHCGIIFAHCQRTLLNWDGQANRKICIITCHGQF